MWSPKSFVFCVACFNCSSIIFDSFSSFVKLHDMPGMILENVSHKFDVALKSGQMPFYTSTNNVVLSPGIGDKGLIPPMYFRSVFDPKTQ